MSEKTKMYGNVFCDWGFSSELVTPERAARYLKNNHGNRKLKPSVVARYAATMLSGNWVLSPEAICFAPDGRVLNGQHRLTAVINSGVPTPFLIIRGVSPEVFKVLDRGATRTIADALGVDRKIAEVARLAASLVTPVAKHGGNVITDAAAEQMIGVLSDDHTDLLSECAKATKIFSSAPVRLAACVRLLAGYDREYVKGTYKGLVLGHIGDLSPIAQSAVGSVLSGRWDGAGSGGEKQRNSLARAWDLFDPAKANNQRVLLRAPDRAISEITAVLRACLAGEQQ